MIYKKNVFSSGDSLGVPVDEQKRRYDDIVNQHPSSILSLEHEVYGEVPTPCASFHRC